MMRLKVSLHTDVFTTYKNTWEGLLQSVVSGAIVEKSHFNYGILGPVHIQDSLFYV